MEVGSRAGFPAGNLSNFTPHAFVFEGVECASMEGLLQSFKSEDLKEQVEICKLVGFNAKRRGQELNEAWKSCQTLWWQGRAFDRQSKEYQLLLDKAFDALAENKLFRHALLASGDEILTHTIGCSDSRDTVLTEDEFCSRLMRIRLRLKQGI